MILRLPIPFGHTLSHPSTSPAHLQPTPPPPPLYLHLHYQAALLAAVERSGGRTELLWPAELRAFRLPPEEGGGVPGVGQQQQEAGHSLAEVRWKVSGVVSARFSVLSAYRLASVAVRTRRRPRINPAKHKAVQL